MSVQITFQPEGDSGLVAEGASLWEAARRLGVHLTAECKGRGECDTCAVSVSSGAELLSSLTEPERKILDVARRDRGERLACQARLEKSGTMVVRIVPRPAESSRPDPKKSFRDLPFNQKVGALVELEAVMMFEAMNKLRATSRSVVGKLLKLNGRTEPRGPNTSERK